MFKHPVDHPLRFHPCSALFSRLTCYQVDGERRSYDPNFVETKPPHVYAIADKAYRNMTTPATEYSQRSQSIMVSGESGAGKTETCKIIMKVCSTAFA